MKTQWPEKLRPYIFHGLDIVSHRNNEAVCSACPFCDKPNKFSINSLTGQWKCWSCAQGTKKGGGNVYVFLKELHAIAMEMTSVEDYSALAKGRLLEDAQPLIEWQIAKSPFTNDWLVPGYNQSCQMTSLYRYIKQPHGGFRLIPTPTLGHRLHGMNLWVQDKPIVYICEGPWDAIALWEVLVRARNSEGKLVRTASVEHSLYSQSNVVAIPGCETFFDTWLPLFQGKIVNIMFDSDHPRKHSKTGHITAGAGWRGTERISKLLHNSKYKPEEISCVHWGEEGYDPKLKSGYDIRDFITKG